MSESLLEFDARVVSCHAQHTQAAVEGAEVVDVEVDGDFSAHGGFATMLMEIL